MTRKNRGEKRTNFLLYCKSESRVLPLKIKLGKLEAKRNDEYWTLFNEDVIDREEIKSRELALKESITTKGRFSFGILKANGNSTWPGRRIS